MPVNAVRLTRARHTRAVFGHGYGVSEVRHQLIAFNRVRNVGTTMSLKRYDTVASISAGHGRLTDNMQYAVDEDTPDGLPMDILPQLIEASVEWHKDLHLVPGTSALVSPTLALIYVRRDIYALVWVRAGQFAWGRVILINNAHFHF